MIGKTGGPEGTGPVRPDRLTPIAFVLLVLLGGANGVAVRFSNFELPPFWGAAFRLIAAALIFWAILIARRVPLPRGRVLIGTLLYGILGMGAGLAFLYWGLVKVQASTAATIFALNPLLTMFFAVAHGLERFRWRGLAGGLIALAGISLGLGGGLGGTVPIPSLLALVIGVACICEGSVVFKLFPKASPAATNAIAATTGAVILLPLSLLAGESWFLPTSRATWAAFAYLVVAGSVAMFYFYLIVLSRWTATATSYAFLLFPVAGVSLAAWLAHETITPMFLVGTAIVLFGVWVGALNRSDQPIGEDASLSVQPAAVGRAPTSIEARPCENC
jgi:drug/metabolite transporter (DMT)-like permease